MALWALAGLLASASCGGPSAAGDGQPRWSDWTCSWPIVPRIIKGSGTVSLQEAAPMLQWATHEYSGTLLVMLLNNWYLEGQDGFPPRLQLALEVEGEHLILDLAQNRELLAGTQRLFYYLPDGTRAMHPTGTEGNCCYRGGIQGYPGSQANICICSSLSGLLVVSKERSYILESRNEETRAYRLEAVRQASGECSVVSPSPEQLRSHVGPEQTLLRRAKRDAETENRYVELVIVADKAEFKLDPDINRTRLRMLEIASYMDGFYQTLGLRVALVGVEIWNERDPVSMAGSPQEVLERFLQWREKDLLPRIPHDNVQLIMGSPFPGGMFGASTQGSICSKRSGGINMDHSVSPLVMASTLSHQLGHNLGFNHDGAGCGCDGSSPNLPPGRSCIMEPPTGIMPGLTFSSCTHQQVKGILQSSRVWCLRDVPEPGRLVGSLCGNRLVEPGEECDCGLRLECEDPCCNATFCRLMAGAQCATGGACCHECKLRSAGFVCRGPQNECDLPEFCDGASPRCPTNVHKQDGTPCEGGKAICFDGACPTYLSQCQELWGPGSVPVSDTCVASLNGRGDLKGHCGQQASGSYIPCGKSDVWCGRLQCQDSGVNARKQNRTTREPACPHSVINPADDTVDLAMVLSGTACGPSKVCVERRCRDLLSLELPKCQCNGHGVCNSKGHCHCQPGWAPPNCQSSGAGGSVDSGPPAKEQASHGTSTALLLTALFLILVLAFGLCFAKRIGIHKRLCQFGKGTSCQYSAEAESRVRFLHPVEPRGITQPEPRSYSQAPPERPRPPQWRQNTELQLMPSSKQPVHLDVSRLNPPSKPLPPDPVQKGQQALIQDRPAPPTRPLPADPIPKDAQPPGPAKPPPPRKPLPSDPPRAELCAFPSYDPCVQMLPSRPAPPPPPPVTGPSVSFHEV